MDAQDFRSLQEAYNQVYQVDETIRNPESRKKLRAIMDREVVKGDKSKGQNPRKKYHTKTGDQAFSLLMKRDETGSKDNPVRKRGGTNAPPEERVGKGPNRAGNAKYWAGTVGPTRDRGAGNKAARRAGKSVPNTRDVDESFDIYDIILSHLLDEGYADTEQAATAIMVNMSEEWRESIVENVSSGRSKVRNVKQRVSSVEVISNTQKQNKIAQHFADHAAKKKSAGDEAHAEATKAGKSPSDAETARQRAHRKYEKEMRG